MFVMEQTVTAKLQILVSPDDRGILHDTMRAYAAACDFVSDYVFQTKELRRFRLHKELYHTVREQFSLGAQMACSCFRTVVSTYRAILTAQKKWIRPSFRHPQLDLVWNRDYSLLKDQDLLSVNTLKGRIRVSFCRQGFEQYFSQGCTFGTAKLIFKHGRFFLCIPVTYEVEDLPLSQVTNVVGVDRGIRFPAVAYDCAGKTQFFDGRQIKQKRAHYKALRSDLQKVGTPSSRKRLKAIGQRENRWMQDVNHCIAKALSGSQPEGTLFVIEDLTGIRGATERVRTKDRYVTVSWSYYDLEQKLLYKAHRSHQRVVKADPAYTSQRCPVCGHTEKKNRDKRNHLFCCCRCGYRSNDDRIAAMNLHRMGIDLVPDAAGTEHDSVPEAFVSMPAM